jgi:hypothetical protein
LLSKQEHRTVAHRSGRFGIFNEERTRPMANHYPPFDDNLYYFASAVADMCYSRLEKAEKKNVYHNMLFTPQQLVEFYQHYAAHLVACCRTESHNLSSSIFSVEFLKKADLTVERMPECLRVYGLRHAEGPAEECERI